MVRTESEMALGEVSASPVKAVPDRPERVVDVAKLANLDWYLLDLVASELGLPSRGHLGAAQGVEWLPLGEPRVCDVDVFVAVMGGLPEGAVADVAALLAGFAVHAMGRRPVELVDGVELVASRLRHPAGDKSVAWRELAGLLHGLST